MNNDVTVAALIQVDIAELNRLAAARSTIEKGRVAVAGRPVEGKWVRSSIIEELDYAFGLAAFGPYVRRRFPAKRTQRVVDLP